MNRFFQKNCQVAVTAAIRQTADFLLVPHTTEPVPKDKKKLFSATPNNSEWDLKDKTGKTVFSSSAWREVNTAKDVCNYFTAKP